MSDDSGDLVIFFGVLLFIAFIVYQIFLLIKMGVTAVVSYALFIVNYVVDLIARLFMPG